MSRVRRLIVPGLATLVCAAILAALGTWQLHRLAWKEGLLQAVAERSTGAPLALHGLADFAELSADGDEYRRVSVRGRFDHAKEIQVYTILGEQKGPFGGPGYWVLTPLALDGGGTVFVNRGFVPPDRRNPATRTAGQLAGDVAVTGLLRAPEQRNLFTPADDPAKGAWYNRDPAEIAPALGIADAAPFLVDADGAPNPGGLPEGGETRLVFTNSHLQYALTWYGLGLGLVGVFLAWAFGAGKDDAPARSGPGQLESPSSRP